MYTELHAVLGCSGDWGDVTGHSPAVSSTLTHSVRLWHKPHAVGAIVHVICLKTTPFGDHELHALKVTSNMECVQHTPIGQGVIMQGICGHEHTLDITRDKEGGI